MILIWTGRGALIFFVFIVMLVLALAVTVTQFADPWNLSDDQGVAVTVAIGALLSAVATYPLDRWAMIQPPDKTLVDPQTGQTHVLRNRDSLFWIETRYWTYLFAALAAVMAVVARFV